MVDVPRLDAVSPASARPGTQLTLTGAAFGVQTANSAVRFRLPEQGAAPVSGTIVDWAEGTVHARVPALASFGSGGPLEVSVHTDGGDSGAVGIVLEEESPPAIAAVTPARGLENDTVTMTGERFGRPLADSAVLFQAPGPIDVPAAVVTWAPTSVTVRVPSLTSLGGAGQRSVVVRTRWGRSATATFLLGELPEVTGVVPASPSPGATITVQGRAFGPAATGILTLVAVYENDDPDAPPNENQPPIVSWTDTEIRATLPDLPVLRTTGQRDVVVTSEWGANRLDERCRILIESRASITCWTRVEPHARTGDLQDGLQLGMRAQVYDALWLLGRQWQLLELRGEDAGSPVSVRVQGSCTPLARWQPFGGQAEDVPGGVPLEALVERERVLPPLGPGAGPFSDLRLSAEAGLHLLRLIDGRLRNADKSNDYRQRFLHDYPLQAPADLMTLDAASRRFLGVVAERVPDGSRLYTDFQVALGPDGQLPDRPPIDGIDRPGVLAAIRDWYAWCADLFSEPATEQHAWNRQRMEYSFAAGSGDVVLDADEHDGGHLDWYSFIRRPPGSSLGAPPVGREPTAFTRTAIPNAVSYPGMPVARWWELEDTRVDFGAVAAAPSELLTLVLVEFATVYGNDWFTVPLDALPVGTLCEIQTVTVTDAFGTSIVLAPFGGGAGGDWRMFELARSDGAADAGNALLLLDALPATQESAPLEEVLLLRDELANMAWAVEKAVEGRTGRPLNRHEDEVASRPSPAEPAATRRYMLHTPVPRHWIPLLPKLDRDGAGTVQRRFLARGAMREAAGGTVIPPRGRLLEPGVPLDIYDEEVPREGARVTRLWTIGRAANGRTYLWRGRRKGSGRKEGSIGLRFDDSAMG